MFTPSGLFFFLEAKHHALHTAHARAPKLGRQSSIPQTCPCTGKTVTCIGEKRREESLLGRELESFKTQSCTQATWTGGLFLFLFFFKHCITHGTYTRDTRGTARSAPKTWLILYLNLSLRGKPRANSSRAVFKEIYTYIRAKITIPKKRGYKMAPQTENPGNRLVHSSRKIKF